MFLKKLISHSLIYALAPQLPKIASLFVLPIITQHLTAQDYGVYGIITSYVGIVSAVSDLGLVVILLNSFFQYPVKWKIIWKQIHFYLLCWSVIYSAFLGTILFLIIPTEFRNYTWEIIFLICIPQILFSPVQVIASRFYQFSRKPLYIGITSAIVGIVAIFLNLYTIAYLKMGFMGWFWSTAISSFIQFLFFAYPVYFKYKLAPLWSFRKHFLWKQLKVSLPVVPHNYSSYLLNSSDRMVMDRLHINISNVGMYNMAYLFGNYFEFGGNAIGMAVGPVYTGMIAKRTKKSETNLFTLAKWLQIGFILIGVVLALWCKELMNVLIKNDELKLAYPIAIIILMSYVYRPYYWLCVNRLIYYQKTSQLWKISFIAGVLNLILNFIFIPVFGVQAAAITTFAAMMYMGFSGYSLKSFRELNTFNIRYKPLIVVITIIVSTIAVYILKDAPFILKLLFTLLCISGFTIYSFSMRRFFKEAEI